MLCGTLDGQFAAFTFLTGLYLLYWLSITVNIGIVLGAVMATFMAANVWFVIWPNQKFPESYCWCS